MICWSSGERTMAQVSSVGEAIELAISREIQSAEFYTDLAGRMKTVGMRELFERLASEELEHKGRLELELMKEGLVAETLGRLVDVGPAGYSADLPDEDKLEYKDVLELAIRKERLSFRFYAQLSGLIGESEVQEVLLELAEEEARHVVLFEIEYNRTVAQGE